MLPQQLTSGATHLKFVCLVTLTLELSLFNRLAKPKSPILTCSTQHAHTHDTFRPVMRMVQ